MDLPHLLVYKANECYNLYVPYTIVKQKSPSCLHQLSYHRLALSTITPPVLLVESPGSYQLSSGALAATRGRSSTIKSYIYISPSGWWCKTFFILPYIENNHPN